MFKIKLSISLLISFIFVSCAKDNLIFDNRSYSIGYVSGEYDGLVLKNLLTNNLSVIVIIKGFKSDGGIEGKKISCF